MLMDDLTRLGRRGNASAGGGSGHTPLFVNFDGTNDYLTRGAALTGGADNKFFAFVFRITPRLIGVYAQIAASALNKIQIRLDADGRLRVILKNGANAKVLEAFSTALSVDTEYHVAFFCDLADSGNRGFLLKGVDASDGWTTYSNDTIDHTDGTDFGVAAGPTGVNLLNADLADFYVWQEYGDILTNIAQFYAAAGDQPDPADQTLFSDPIIAFQGLAAVWNAGTNAGTGGVFTMTGAVTDVAGAGPGAPAYDYELIRWDGVEDYLLRNDDLTGAVDGKEFSFVLRFNPRNIIGTQNIAASDLNKVQIRLESDGRLQVILKNAANDKILEAYSTVLSVDTEYHIAFFCDLSDAGKRGFLRDGVDAVDSWTTYTDDTIDFNDGPDFAVGSNPAGLNKCNAEMADFFMWHEYGDILTNIAQFYAASGDQPNPAENTVFGSPIVAFQGVASVWNQGQNTGTGGDFTMQGNVASIGGGGGGGSPGTAPIPRGLWLKANQDTLTGRPPPSFWAACASSPRIRGATIILAWHATETAQGVYDWSAVEEAIENATAIGIDVGFELRARLFSTPSRIPATAGPPAYIINDHATYGGFSGAGGLALTSDPTNVYTVRFWDANVMERLIQWMEAFYGYVRDREIVKACWTNESTVSQIDTGSADASDYTVNGIMAQYLKRTERCTAAGGSETRHVETVNFIKNGTNTIAGDIGDYYDFLFTNGAGISFPDPDIGSDWATNFTYSVHEVCGEGSVANPGKNVPVLAMGEQFAYNNLSGYIDPGATTLEDMMRYLIEHVKCDSIYKSFWHPAGSLGWEDVVSIIDEPGLSAPIRAGFQAWAEAPDGELLT